MAASAARRWTTHEIGVFETRRAEKVAPKLIAEELGRSLGSVTMRCQIANVRKCRRRILESDNVRVQIEPQHVIPPTYVMREREIRQSIPRTTATQVQFADPVEGYSGLDNKVRKISVQDALEICALYNGKPAEIVALATSYGVSRTVIEAILNGRFFDQLIKYPRRS